MTNQHTRRQRKNLAKAQARQAAHLHKCRTCWASMRPCVVATVLAEKVASAAVALAAARGHVEIEE